MEQKKRGSFGGSLGFVLAAAGSAVGLGNIWRFPALAAKDGGGLFLVIYLILAITFGFTLLLTEVAIGRKTKQSPLTAYGRLHKKSGWIGGFACAVPFIIMPYYCVIGGWVLKYLIVFLTGKGSEATDDGFFGGFITGNVEPIVFTVIFAVPGFREIYSSKIAGSSETSRTTAFIRRPAQVFCSSAVSGTALITRATLSPRFSRASSP